MLDGKLRIAPTCYHMLHQVPVMTAHEMNFFYDEGLVTPHGTRRQQQRHGCSTEPWRGAQKPIGDIADTQTLFGDHREQCNGTAEQHRE